MELLTSHDMDKVAAKWLVGTGSGFLATVFAWGDFWHAVAFGSSIAVSVLTAVNIAWHLTERVFRWVKNRKK